MSIYEKTHRGKVVSNEAMNTLLQSTACCVQLDTTNTEDWCVAAKEDFIHQNPELNEKTVCVTLTSCSNGSEIVQDVYRHDPEDQFSINIDRTILEIHDTGTADVEEVSPLQIENHHTNKVPERISVSELSTLIPPEYL